MTQEVGAEAMKADPFGPLQDTKFTLKKSNPWIILNTPFPKLSSCVSTNTGLEMPLYEVGCPGQQKKMIPRSLDAFTQDHTCGLVG